MSSRFAPSGFTLLLSMLVVGAVATTVGIAFLVLSTGSITTQRIVMADARATWYAQTCVERWLKMLRQGTHSLPENDVVLNPGSCKLTIADSDSTWILTWRSQVDGVTKRYTVVIDQIHPKIRIQSAVLDIPNP